MHFPGNGWKPLQADGWMDGWTDRWMDSPSVSYVKVDQLDVQMDGWTNELMDGVTILKHNTFMCEIIFWPPQYFDPGVKIS